LHNPPQQPWRLPRRYPSVPIDLSEETIAENQPRESLSPSRCSHAPRVTLDLVPPLLERGSIERHPPIRGGWSRPCMTIVVRVRTRVDRGCSRLPPLLPWP
jgi:hypothetical protein